MIRLRPVAEDLEILTCNFPFFSRSPISSNQKKEKTSVDRLIMRRSYKDVSVSKVTLISAFTCTI